MPRPRHSESFSVRWHSLANPATPSADIMSSPDPLNDATERLPLPPPPSSSRRLTRGSIQSQRFASVASSPRKQMFELQVGDNRSPQKLWVTVETDAAAASAAAHLSRGTSRKLFQSPSSTPAAPRRRRERAVTTTVPLQASIEDEPGPAHDANVTPKRRGRPRKINGTPMPGASKRKATTPADTRSPRRPRVARKSREPDESQSHADAEPTPRRARRGRPPKDKSALAPSLEMETEAATPRASPAKRSRRTRPATVSEDVEGLADPAVQHRPRLASRSATASEDGMNPVGAIEQQSPASPPAPPAPVEDDGDSDIWMATVSNEATPRTTALPTQARPSPSPSHREPHQASLPESFGMPTSEAGDYIDFAPAASDISSIDEPVEASAPRQTDDTIAQGEDFSMIFMDSIPSLQGVFKSSIPPAAQEELGEETSLIINNTLQSFRQEGGAHDVEMDALAPVEPTPAQPESLPDEDELAPNEPTPTRATATRPQSRGASPSWPRPPRKAADSSPLRHRVLRLTARQADESVAAGAGKMSEEDPLATSQRTNAEASYPYDDSFSEIPQAFLVSATPGYPNTAMPYDGDDDDEQDEQGEARGEQAEETDGKGEDEAKEREYEEERVDLLQDDDIPQREGDEDVQDDEGNARQDPEPALGSSASSASRSEAGRLPTPDDTPPQLESQDAGEQVRSDGASGTSSKAASPAKAKVEPEPPGADVPGPSDSAARPEESQSPEAAGASTQSVEATPVHQISSPLQEPQSVQPEAWQHDRTVRPALSAIVRAGRALQSITSDPPSPEGRMKQLGSPFRNSGSRDSWNGSLTSQNSRRMSRSPQQLPAFAEARAPGHSPPAREDPFGAAASQDTTGQTRFMQALGVRMPAEQGPSPSSSMRFTPNSDGVMSWVAREGPISPRLRGDNTLQQAARRSAGAGVGVGVGVGPGPGQLAPSPVDEDGGDGDAEEQDDEMDIWEFEAQRETPRVARQQPFGKRVATPSHGRSLASGIWAGGQAGKLDSPAKAANGPGPRERAASPERRQSAATSQVSEADEYSLVAQRLRQQQQQQQQQQQDQQDQQDQQQGGPSRDAESASKASRFDLSSFFSSPAAIPGMLAHKFLPAKASAAMFGPVATSGRPEPAAPVMPTSSMFPPVPPSEQRRRSMLSSSATAEAARTSEAGYGRGGHGSSSPRRSVTPRRSSRQSSRRATSQPLSQQQQRQLSVATTPPQMQLSHADIHRWQQETSHAGTAQPPPGLPRPLLRPLPPKNASPTKSSLRSPLKPRTPGRVVDFTSSVLSPAEQARARHERRLSIASVPSLASLARPGVAPAPPPPPPTAVTAGHKGHGDADDVSMLDAPSLDTQGEDARAVDEEDTPEPPLSQTVWTRRHWLLLDELLQRRRRAPFAPANHDDEQRAAAHRYLGKTVKSQGEAMRLERWHLDVVDAFGAVVGGWDEGVLAKRLFALILGEERRRRSRVERSSPVMFH